MVSTMGINLKNEGGFFASGQWRLSNSYMIHMGARRKALLMLARRVCEWVSRKASNRTGTFQSLVVRPSVQPNDVHNRIVTWKRSCGRNRGSKVLLLLWSLLLTLFNNSRLWYLFFCFSTRVKPPEETVMKSKLEIWSCEYQKFPISIICFM